MIGARRHTRRIRNQFVADGSEAGPELMFDLKSELIRRLVGRLRERTPDGVRGVLSELLARRDRAMAHAISRGGRERD